MMINHFVIQIRDNSHTKETHISKTAPKVNGRKFSMFMTGESAVALKPHLIRESHNFMGVPQTEMYQKLIN